MIGFETFPNFHNKTTSAFPAYWLVLKQNLNYDWFLDYLSILIGSLSQEGPSGPKTRARWGTNSSGAVTCIVICNERIWSERRFSVIKSKLWKVFHLWRIPTGSCLGGWTGSVSGPQFSLYVGSKKCRILSHLHIGNGDYIFLTFQKILLVSISSIVCL